MSPILLKAYRAEFNSTHIELEAIKKKYSLTDEDVKDWSQGPKEPETEKTLDIFKEPEVLETIIVPNQTPSEPSTVTQQVVTMDKEKLQEDIDTFKRHAMKFALDEMADGVVLEIKEFKDLVAVVTNIETSIKDTRDTGPTINILVQNLTEKFTDDC